MWVVGHFKLAGKHSTSDGNSQATDVTRRIGSPSILRSHFREIDVVGGKSLERSSRVE